MSIEETSSLLAGIPISSLAMAMLFGSITFTTAALTMKTWLKTGDIHVLRAAMKPRSQPLDTNSLVSIFTLLYHSTTFGMILFFAYICENHPLYPHDEKVYDRDQFFFLVVLLFLFGFYTLHKHGQDEQLDTTSTAAASSGVNESILSSNAGRDEVENVIPNSSMEDCHPISVEDRSSSSLYDKSNVQVAYLRVKEAKSYNDVLNRDQTEEWKGWMQFVFLIYHYYHAEEVYNSIRIMITCYVWMTGFGNFSFFYLKNDFSFVRVIQMLWRLNFLVVFLCLSQGTTYILYYICPLHTYYFLMVYAAMRVGKRLNYSKFGLRVKLAIVALIIYLVWDVDLGLFKVIHYPLVGSKPTLGATHGTMWEWYFRSTLDHWSSLLGMIFAANYPIVSLFYRKLEAMSPSKCWLGKGCMGVSMMFAFVVWVRGPFQLEKFDYNVTNPYFGFVPLITYIYFRNLTPGLRSHSLKVLHEIGKTTLETYLMQHHIWLASNAKSLLVLIPGWPKINMVVITIIYFFVSRKLYKVTIFLRGMLLPNDSKRCIQSLLAMVCIIMFFYSIAYYLYTVGFVALKAIAIVSVLCGCFLYILVIDKTWESYTSAKSHDDEVHRPPGYFSEKSSSKASKFLPPITGGTVLLILGVVWQRLAIAGGVKIGPLHQRCETLVNNGHWISVDGCNEVVRGEAFRNEAIQNFATCGSPGAAYMWGWEVSMSSARCRFTQRNAKQLTKNLSHRRIGFVGDSMTRYLYHAFSRLLGMKDAGSYDANGPKHSNITHTVDHTLIDFIWAPFAIDQLQIIKDMNEDTRKWNDPTYDLVLIGGGAWDRLHRFSNDEEMSALGLTISDLVEQMKIMKKAGIPIVWITPTTINTPALNSPEKRDHMTEEDMNDMRSIYEQLGVNQAASFVLDGPSFSEERVHESFDGVHYPIDVYVAGAQIFANALDWLLPEVQSAEKFSSPEPGKMARPLLGFIMLCLCFIGLFCFDGFYGFSYVTCLFVKGILPNDLYLEAFSILHEKCDLPPLNASARSSPKANQSKKPKKTVSFPQKITRRKKVTFNDDEEVELINQGIGNN
mmetsp:Transcript_7865/g.14820  ORF Transcript_7865/g.14820 Transcript_7865/m.14820 type:complete len:1065 (-) Transcript_7865:25-3219(-)|eukprot:CAMPEP_0176506218 /NCGR_PEP_ID=MMETSP0200_2-20121128/16915_1 /TAXON_ID=947934 /ORGANISM="Chaetoceros sp., Strain GSL56" /LENGTH=1064 /DNA_ID=CAMNT_0017905833 /DNA_START=117 /DNA_END=3311 /DNA_ORIENTATION=-